MGCLVSQFRPAPFSVELGLSIGKARIEESRRSGNQGNPNLRPKAVGRPIQARHLQYFWDGRRISRYFDYALDRWVALEPPW
jgi:hypothetical protein